VRSILPTGGKLLVSPSGGVRPVWRRDGKEIFYLSTTGELMAAKVKQNSYTLEIDTPTRLSLRRAWSPSFPVLTLVLMASDSLSCPPRSRSSRLPSR